VQDDEKIRQWSARGKREGENGVHSAVFVGVRVWSRCVCGVSACVVSVRCVCGVSACVVSVSRILLSFSP